VCFHEVNRKKLYNVLLRLILKLLMAMLICIYFTM
jgi:hypothetical protein